MKKTRITLLALCGVAAAEVAPTSIWSRDDYDLTTTDKIDLTSLNLSTVEGAKGYTLMLTFSSDVNFTAGAGSILWLSSVGATDTGSYTNSTGTLGYRSGGGLSAGLSTFNAANGSSTTGSVKWNGGGISHDNANFGGTTVFMTSQGGVATLYELTSDGNLKLTSQNNGLLSAEVKSMWIGNWSTSGANFGAGTADIALYSGVLTTSQMKSLMAPEPTTATLSLLALAGLAARRRRK